MKTRVTVISVRFSAALAFAFAGGALAQAFPSTPITLVVPWPPGGGSDIAMRMVADAASKRLGQPMVVVNKPGAGGTIGLKEVASAKPDGTTLGMVATGAIFAQYNNPNANAMADFEPIAFFGDDPALLSANAKTGFKSVADFVAAAKANPGKFKNGNDQPGGSSFITASLLEKKLGVRLVKVPYAGFAPTVQALLSGEVDTVTVPAPDIVQHQKSGAANLLGVAGTSRHFMTPDVPTFREQGIDFVSGTWRVIVGPKGIPADRLATLDRVRTYDRPLIVIAGILLGLGILFSMATSPVATAAPLIAVSAVRRHANSRLLRRMSHRSAPRPVAFKRLPLA